MGGDTEVTIKRSRAEIKLTNAYKLLKAKPARTRLFHELQNTPTPITNRTRCPIDISALRDYAASNEGDTTFNSNKQHLPGETHTVEKQINDFLNYVTISRLLYTVT
jgi:hypothetical protein